MNEGMCYFRTNESGVVIEIALMSGRRKVYRTAKKWLWENLRDWQERINDEIKEMKNRGMRLGWASDVRLGQVRPGRRQMAVAA